MGELATTFTTNGDLAALKVAIPFKLQDQMTSMLSFLSFLRETGNLCEIN